jgi:hypothetical protein
VDTDAVAGTDADSYAVTDTGMGEGMGADSYTVADTDADARLGVDTDVVTHSDVDAVGDKGVGTDFLSSGVRSAPRALPATAEAAMAAASAKTDLSQRSLGFSEPFRESLESL